MRAVVSAAAVSKAWHRGKVATNISFREIGRPTSREIRMNLWNEFWPSNFCSMIFLLRISARIRPPLGNGLTKVSF